MCIAPFFAKKQKKKKVLRESTNLNIKKNHVLSKV